MRLHWTTPTQTTDKLPIKGPVTAEICRETAAAGKTPCLAIPREHVTSGPSDAVDLLPQTLTSGPARLLSYRVQLFNSAGRTAGPSPPVFAVAGEAPKPVEDFTCNTTRTGVLLRWRADAADVRRSLERIELDRTTLDSRDETGEAQSPDLVHKSGWPGGQKQAAETRYRPDARDGGALDRTAEVGHSYSYTAQRVHLVEVAGHALELKSVPTAAATLAVRDEFAPDVPSGLVTVPGLAGEGAAQKPTIDLSWEPDVEARVAGYRVYRREVSANNSGVWVRLDLQLETTAAYRDLTVVAGHRYAYRVTAVSTAGNESGASGEAVETASSQ